jgi:heterodisulfide reductase subunit A-like polyferredoxin
MNNMSEESTPEDSQEEIKESRIGVFVCRCGINIAGAIDVQKVVENAKSLPGVQAAEENLSYCTEAGAVAIQKAIDENQLDRVVIAA